MPILQAAVAEGLRSTPSSHCSPSSCLHSCGGVEAMGNLSVLIYFSIASQENSLKISDDSDRECEDMNLSGGGGITRRVLEE